jgi:hypothetical protein
MVSQTYYQTAVDQAMGRLNVAEMIARYAGYYSCPRPVDDVVEVAGLTEKRNSGVVKLSGVSGAVFGLAEYLYDAAHQP